jgi:hypothetical protein
LGGRRSRGCAARLLRRGFGALGREHGALLGFVRLGLGLIELLLEHALGRNRVDALGNAQINELLPTCDAL